jgi:peptide deformylase
LIQTIVTLPDERLLQVCAPVGDEDVEDVIRDLWNTCDSLKELDGEATSCVGLAAPPRKLVCSSRSSC